MKHAVQLFSLHTLDGKEGILFAKSFVICGCYDDGLWPDDYSPTPTNLNQVIEVREVKGLAHQ